MSEQIAHSTRQLGDIIRRSRKQQGLTQSRVGQQGRLPQCTLSQLETGEPTIQLHSLLKVLATLNLELVVRARAPVDAHILRDADVLADTHAPGGADIPGGGLGAPGTGLGATADPPVRPCEGEICEPTRANA